MERRVLPAVKALIEVERTFLALKNRIGDDEFWNIPGGRVEFKESPTDALHREVREEVSLDITVHEPVGMYHFFFGDREQNHVVSTVFRCSRSNGTVDISSNPIEEPIIGYEWVTPETFVNRTVEPTLESVIRRYYGLS